jgi:hypothetical protein
MSCGHGMPPVFLATRWLPDGTSNEILRSSVATLCFNGQCFTRSLAELFDAKGCMTHAQRYQRPFVRVEKPPGYPTAEELSSRGKGQTERGYCSCKRGARIS